MCSNIGGCSDDIDTADFLAWCLRVRAHSDSYWRLDVNLENDTNHTLKHVLQGLGWKVRSSDTKAKLVQSLQKAMSGRMDYSGCTLEEMLKFAQDRGVDLEGASKARTIAPLLMAADDERIFPRFMDLLPELRNLVYKFSLDSLPKRITAPAMPPLARADAKLKKEFLPLFLSERVISLPFVGASSNGRHKVRAALSTQQILHDYLNENARHLRHFRMVVYRSQLDAEWHRTRLPMADIVVRYKPSATPSKANRYRFRVAGFASKRLDHVKSRKSVLRTAVRKVLRNLGERSSKILDVYDISKAVEQVVNHSADELKARQSIARTTT